jgi:hypothetical protein
MGQDAFGRGCFEFCVKRLFLDTGGADGNRQRANR